MKFALLAALSFTVLLCSIGLSCAQKIPPSAVSSAAPQQTTIAPPTLLPHFYTDHYATERTTIKKLIDGTRAVIFFLGQQNALNSLWQGRLLPTGPFGLQEDYRDAIKAAIDIFKIESSANALDTAVLTSVKSDICNWLSNEITGFSCSENTLHQLSRTLELYQTIRSTRDQLVALDDGDEQARSGYRTSHYRCGWVNNHVLGSCLNIPVPRSQDPKVVKLEEIFRCSVLSPTGDYALCSSVA